MPRDGSGNYSLPSNSWNPAVGGTPALPADWQALINDVAAALGGSIARDGQSAATGSLPMSGHRLTGLGAGVAAHDSARWEQLFSGGAPQSLPAAAAIDVGAPHTLFLTVTGSASITSLGTTFRGPRFVRFDAALTLVHSASLVLPGARNLVVSAGDVVTVIPIGTPAAAWAVIGHHVASPVTPATLSMLSGHINGLEMRPAPATPTTDLEVGIGIAVTAGAVLELLAPMTKRCTLAWSQGSGGGALDAGTFAANTWFNVFIIGHSTSGAVDVLLSTSMTPAMPSGWTHRRRIGSVLSTGTSTIRPFRQNADTFTFVEARTEWTNVNLALNSLMHVNVGGPHVVHRPVMSLRGTLLSGSGSIHWSFFDGRLSAPEVPSGHPLTMALIEGANGTGASSVVDAYTTNAAGHLYLRIGTNQTVLTLSLAVIGWHDPRGRT